MQIDQFGVPRVGVCLAVRRDDKVLLHKRKSEHANGTWAFAGGHLELWESFEDCARRELREEAGDLTITKPYLWEVVNTTYPDEGRHYVVICMVADWVSGEAKVMEPEKCEEWIWRSWDDLPAPLMAGIQYLKDHSYHPFVVVCR